jgi:hypothetical protein
VEGDRCGRIGPYRLSHLLFLGGYKKSLPAPYE